MHRTGQHIHSMSYEINYAKLRVMVTLLGSKCIVSISASSFIAWSHCWHRPHALIAALHKITLTIQVDGARNSQSNGASKIALLRFWPSNAALFIMWTSMELPITYSKWQRSIDDVILVWLSSWILKTNNSCWAPHRNAKGFDATSLMMPYAKCCLAPTAGKLTSMLIWLCALWRSSKATCHCAAFSQALAAAAKDTTQGSKAYKGKTSWVNNFDLQHRPPTHRPYLCIIYMYIYILHAFTVSHTLKAGIVRGWCCVRVSENGLANGRPVGAVPIATLLPFRKHW